MAERENKKSVEKHSPSNEHLVEVSQKQKEVIRSKLDDAEKQHLERQMENEALSEATELAQDADNTKEERQRSASPAERRLGAPSRKQLNGSFKNQMKDVQSEMGPGSQLISKLIHIKPVEKISDTLGSTVARPNAMLSGSIAAFAVITALYFIARHYGYKLSGFETIAAFCIGWLLGIIYDYLATLLRRRKKS